MIPEATASFLTKQFGLITQMAFLSLLSSSPKVSFGSTSFDLTPADNTLYDALQSGYSKFTKAMTIFAKKNPDLDDKN